jgi:hypothetical protein
MNELSASSNLFSDDIKKRTYFVANFFLSHWKMKLKLGLAICL